MTIERDLGRIDADLATVKHDINQIKSSLSSIEKFMAETKGSWRAIVFISGISATIGGVIVKLIPWLTTLR